MTGSAMPAQRESKRKMTQARVPPPGAAFVDLASDEPSPVTKKQKTQTQKKRVNDSTTPEKRARRYRSNPPQSYLDRLNRIAYQRSDFLL